MEEGRIKFLQRQAVEATEEAAAKRIEKLKASFVEWLESQKEVVLNENEEVLAEDVYGIISRTEDIHASGDEKAMILDKVGTHVKAQMYKGLKDLTKEIRKFLKDKEGS